MGGTKKNVRESRRVVTKEERILGHRAPRLIRCGAACGKPEQIETNSGLPRIQLVIGASAESLWPIYNIAKQSVAASASQRRWEKAECSVLCTKHSREDRYRERTRISVHTRGDGARETTPRPNRPVVRAVRKRAVETRAGLG